MHEFCLCICGYIWVELEKCGYVYTCVISHLLLKYRHLCGKRVVKLFIVQKCRTLRVLYSLILFPMLRWSFHLKNYHPSLFHRRPPLFLVIIGNNVVHWCRARGYGPGLRVWLPLSAYFMAWDDSWCSSVLLFNSKMGLVTWSYLAQN